MTDAKSAQHQLERLRLLGRSSVVGADVKWAVEEIERLEAERLRWQESATSAQDLLDAACNERDRLTQELAAEKEHTRKYAAQFENERLRAALERVYTKLAVQRNIQRSELIADIQGVLESSAPETARCIHDRVVCEPCAQMAVRSHEKTLALVKEINERHDRVNKLLYGGQPEMTLGPMDSDAAHADRGALLSMLTPAQRGAVETSERRICLGCGKPYPCASDCPAGTALPTTSVTK